MIPILISRRLGLSCYGAVFGAVNMAQSVGAATVPLAAGTMFDAMGTYRWALILFASLYGCAVPAVLLVRQPTRLFESI